MRPILNCPYAPRFNQRSCDANQPVKRQEELVFYVFLLNFHIPLYSILRFFLSCWLHALPFSGCDGRVRKREERAFAYLLTALSKIERKRRTGEGCFLACGNSSNKNPPPCLAEGWIHAKACVTEAILNPSTGTGDVGWVLLNSW